MRIFCDFGHRNNVADRGASSAGINESALALQIGQLVANGFKQAGHEVFYSRESEDDVIGLDARINKANRITNLDWYISVHVNAAENTNAAGFEVLHYGDQEEICSKICKNVCDQTNQKNRGAKIRTDLAVLRKTYCRAILIECGFLSNPQERAKLVTQAFQQKIAEGILESFGIKSSQEPQKNQIEIMLNGVIKKVDYINKEGFNFVKLRDLEDSLIKVDYDCLAKMPLIEIRKL